MLYSETYTACWDNVVDAGRVGYFRQSQAAHQNVFNSMSGRGYRPVTVCGYQSLLGTPQYCSVWKKAGSGAWATHHGIRSGDFQEVFEARQRDGLRPVFIDGFGGSAGVMFNSIWERNAGPRWNAEFGIAADDYQRRFDLRCSEGLRLRSASPYVADGKLHYATVWDDTPTSGWVARHALSIAQFNEETDRLCASGYTLAFARSARLGGKEYYAAVWEQTPSGRAATRHGMDRRSLAQFHNEMRGDGLRLRFVSAVGLGAESDVMLNFPAKKQCKSNWCWATCASAISAYYGSPRKSCELVNLDFNRNDCCGSNTDGLPCNNGGDLARILNKIDMWKTSEGRISFAEIASELAAGRPIGMHITFRAGGEHYMVMCGCQSDSLVYLMDPSNGGFSWIQYARMCAHPAYIWDSSVFTKSP